MNDTPQRVLVFRHGITGYKLGNAARSISDFEEICDLTELGVTGVQETAKELKPYLLQALLIFFISPAARCLHTARLLHEILSPSAPVKLEPRLGEIDNYHRENFVKACTEVYGAEAIAKDEDFLSDVFVFDRLHKVEVKEKLSQESQDYLATLESSQSAEKRAFSALLEHADANKDSLVCFVTHDGIAGQFVRLCGTKSIGLTRGKYVLLERLSTEEWKVVKTNDDAIQF